MEQGIGKMGGGSFWLEVMLLFFQETYANVHADILGISLLLSEGTAGRLGTCRAGWERYGDNESCSGAGSTSGGCFSGCDSSATVTKSRFASPETEEKSNSCLLKSGFFWCSLVLFEMPHDASKSLWTPVEVWSLETKEHQYSALDAGLGHGAQVFIATPSSPITSPCCSFLECPSSCALCSYWSSHSCPCLLPAPAFNNFQVNLCSDVAPVTDTSPLLTAIFPSAVTLLPPSSHHLTV